MSKLIRGLVLGAMVAVLSSATAAVAQEQSMSSNEAIQQYRAGERASLGQPVGHDEAVQQFRSGERASIDQSTESQADRFSPAQPGYREYYQSSRPEQLSQGQASPQAKAEESDRTAVVLSIMAVAAVLVLGLDAMAVRRKARKQAYPAI
jgi:hypothetical protein